MIATAGGNSPSAARSYSAGINFRCVRSPVAPKITMLHGCGTARVDNPSRNGFICCSAERFMNQPEITQIFADYIVRIYCRGGPPAAPKHQSRYGRSRLTRSIAALKEMKMKNPGHFDLV